MSLVLSGVTKVFDSTGGTPHTAVADVSLEFLPGRFYTLLGPSGCGKTTLLRIIAGFEQPTAGNVVYNGKRLNNVPPYEREFPLVFQSYALFPHMTVLENVAYGLRVRKLPRPQTNDKAMHALELLELTPQRDKHPGQLSGGQQQRVALARALVLESPFILLDEPLSNLDAELRVAMRGEIRSLQQRLGITAIYVTHDQEEALAISNEIVVMKDGRVEQSGTPREVYCHPRTEFIARFMGNSNIFPVNVDTSGQFRLLGQAYHAPDAARATHVMVRTDAFELSREGRHEAVVEETTFLGARIQYRLVAESQERLYIDRTADAPALELGSAVRFDLVPEKLHFIRD